MATLSVKLIPTSGNTNDEQTIWKVRNIGFLDYRYSEVQLPIGNIPEQIKFDLFRKKIQ